MRDYMLDKCPVSTYKDIAEVIQEDLGHSPEKLFASIEEIPIASASLAQVHHCALLSCELLSISHYSLPTSVVGPLLCSHSALHQQVMPTWWTGFGQVTHAYQDINSPTVPMAMHAAPEKHFRDLCDSKTLSLALLGKVVSVECCTRCIAQ